MNQFDKETNEAHDTEANSCGNGNLLELCGKKNRKMKIGSLVWHMVPTNVHGNVLVYKGDNFQY